MNHLQDQHLIFAAVAGIAAGLLIAILWSQIRRDLKARKLRGKVRVYAYNRRTRELGEVDVDPKEGFMTKGESLVVFNSDKGFRLGDGRAAYIVDALTGGLNDGQENAETATVNREAAAFVRGQSIKKLAAASLWNIDAWVKAGTVLGALALVGVFTTLIVFAMQRGGA